MSAVVLLIHLFDLLQMRKRRTTVMNQSRSILKTLKFSLQLKDPKPETPADCVRRDDVTVIPVWTVIDVR